MLIVLLISKVLKKWMLGTGYWMLDAVASSFNSSQ